MSNMSYCRFRNTLSDLKDCAQYLHDSDEADPFTELSTEERKNAIKLIKLCGELAADFGEDSWTPQS